MSLELKIDIMKISSRNYIHSTNEIKDRYNGKTDQKKNLQNQQTKKLYKSVGLPI